MKEIKTWLKLINLNREGNEEERRKTQQVRRKHFLVAGLSDIPSLFMSRLFDNFDGKKENVLLGIVKYFSRSGMNVVGVAFYMTFICRKVRIAHGKSPSRWLIHSVRFRDQTSWVLGSKLHSFFPSLSRSEAETLLEHFFHRPFPPKKPKADESNEDSSKMALNKKFLDLDAVA